VVGGDRVDHDRGFTVPADKVGADQGVGCPSYSPSMDLPMVVQQAGPPSQRAASSPSSEGGGMEQSVATLDRVVEDVSACRKTGNAGRPSSLMTSGCRARKSSNWSTRLLAELGDMEVHFLTGAADKFLNAGRVDAAVLEQGLERQLRKPRGARGSNDEISTISGDSSISSVVPVAASKDLMFAPLAADDAALPSPRSGAGRWSR